MTLEWNARKELLLFAHRWPFVLFAFLAGSLLGWFAGYLLPTPHRAEYELYVAYNGDHIYRNPDDYKNWQLGELELFIYSDEVLQAALTALQAGASDWNGSRPEQVRPQLHAYWRNAGKWRLVAEWENPAQAVALVQAWGQAVLERAHAAIDQGQQALILGDQARALARDRADLQQRILVVSETGKALAGWLNSTSQQSGGDALPTLERWRLLSLSAGLAQQNIAGLELLQRFPFEGAALGSYRDWADQAQAASQAELEVLQAQAQELAILHADYLQRWETASKASRNLTVDLTIERLTSEPPEAYAIRPSAQTALVGGVLGLLAWVLVWLGQSRTANLS